MSEYYWNEYIKYYIDEELLKDTLKYHQRSVSKWVSNEKIEKSRISLIRADELKVADVKIDIICNELLGKTTQGILSKLKNLYGSLNEKVSFPIMVLFGQSGEGESGVYSLDLSNNKILLLKKMDEEQKLKWKKVSMLGNVLICFLVDIEQAIALYGKKGYIKGIEEVGYLVNTMKHIFKNDYLLTLPEQEFTHYIGINLKKCLLIDTFIM